MAGARWGGPGQVNCYGVHAEGDSIVEIKSDSRADNSTDRAPDSGTTIFPTGQGREQVIQFHKMLEDAIRREKPRNVYGLKIALGLFEGYFRYFGKR